MHLNNKSECFSCDAECMYGGGVHVLCKNSCVLLQCWWCWCQCYSASCHVNMDHCYTITVSTNYLGSSSNFFYKLKHLNYFQILISLINYLSSLYIPPYGEKISPKPFTYQYNNSNSSKHEEQVSKGFLLCLV